MTYSSSSSMPGASDGGARWMSGLKLLAFLIGVMWVLEIVDTGLGGALDGLGIRPRSVDGLPGLVAAPFLHFGFGHLIANTIPLLAMGALIAVGGARRLLSVTVVVGLISGLGVWLLSSPGSITIGASGIVFGYALYLIVRGIFNRSALQILVGLLVVFLWGGSLLGGLLPQDGISLQGHLFGAIGGLIAAWLLADEKRPARQG